ncbi:MAG TPA: CvpA family protein [Thermomicrobiales bacterium]|nr:CvpA family protein [Thermomicrobiales bacterium]
MTIAPLDVAVITLVGFFAVRGIRRGLVRGVLDLVVLFVAGRGGAALARPAASALDEMGFGLGPATPAVGLAVATLGVAGACLLTIAVGSRVVGVIPLPPPLPFLDSILGLGPGMAKGILAAVAVMMLLAVYQSDLRLSDQVRASRLAPPLYDLGRRVTNVATRQFGFAVPSVDPTAAVPAIDLPWPRIGEP